MKTAFISVLIILSLFLFGCGTDVKPNYFLGMFRDDNDIDRLSECLTEMPQVDGDTLIIKSDIPCLTDISNRDTSDPNVDVTFSKILDNPEFYMDKIVNFVATVKKIHYSSNVELYTNRQDTSFLITSHGAQIHIIDEDGEEADVIVNQEYRFKCRIYEIKINETGRWQIQSEFIVTADKKTILHLPEPVEE